MNWPGGWVIGYQTTKNSSSLSLGMKFKTKTWKKYKKPRSRLLRVPIWFNWSASIKMLQECVCDPYINLASCSSEIALIEDSDGQEVSIEKALKGKPCHMSVRKASYSMYTWKQHSKANLNNVPEVYDWCKWGISQVQMKDGSLASGRWVRGRREGFGTLLTPRLESRGIAMIQVLDQNMKWKSFRLPATCFWNKSLGCI